MSNSSHCGSDWGFEHLDIIRKRGSNWLHPHRTTIPTPILTAPKTIVHIQTPSTTLAELGATLPKTLGPVADPVAVQSAPQEYPLCPLLASLERQKDREARIFTHFRQQFPPKLAAQLYHPVGHEPACPLAVVATTAPVGATIVTPLLTITLTLAV
jgi:hypothetical protein